jgi:hypothetical protein
MRLLVLSLTPIAAVALGGANTATAAASRLLIRVASQQLSFAH